MGGSPLIQAGTETHEEQLARLRAEVEALQGELRRVQRLATVGTMAAMVAHEFNNILTPVINYAQLARKNPAFVQRAIATAADGTQRAAEICEAILGLTQEAATETKRVNLAQLVRATIDATAGGLAKRGVELSVHVPADLVIETHPVELQQVLLNLLLNAREAVVAAGGRRRIELRALADGEEIFLQVSDTGVGIPPEHLNRIFEPFFTTRRDGPDGSKGHGLGLAVCRQIVVGMGGSISAESVPGRGATFSVRLPARAKANPADR